MNFTRRLSTVEKLSQIRGIVSRTATKSGFADYSRAVTLPMLNSFENNPAARGPRAPVVIQNQAGNTQETGSDLFLGAAPHQTGIDRLYARLWLILFFVLIILVLAFRYPIPLTAVLPTIAIFAVGAAVIPRSQMPAVRAEPQSASKAVEPLEIASALIGGLPDPAVILSRDGTVLSFNSKAGELFAGLKDGSHLSSAIRNPQILEAILGGPRVSQTVMFYERVPVERYMAATVSWLGTPNSKMPGILLFLRDLTEQRRLDQLRSDFIANASHEIKTPLASLLGFIETLQGAARHDEAARNRFLGVMAKQAERMARLIDNLMSLSRVEMRAHLKPQDTVQIGELAGLACEALEPMAAERNIKVTESSEVGEAAVLGDRDELMQVFINLLHNAIKYGRSGGSVHVTTRRQYAATKPMIEISIKDDGPGIAAQHLPRLTERFYRVQTPDALEKGGTGLGLAIVKHVLNRHRAELKIYSREGQGSTFVVLLDELELGENLPAGEVKAAAE